MSTRYRYRRWTDRDISILEAMWPSHFAKEIGKKLRRSAETVQAKAKAIGLCRTPEQLAKLFERNPGRFQQGHGGLKTKRTGAVVRRSDGYWWIKVADRAYKQYHRHLWEAQNGPLPTGHILVCNDGTMLSRLRSAKAVRDLVQNGQVVAMPRYEAVKLNHSPEGRKKAAATLTATWALRKSELDVYLLRLLQLAIRLESALARQRALSGIRPGAEQMAKRLGARLEKIKARYNECLPKNLGDTFPHL